ncbi:MAG: hypothetical protein ABEH90_01125 [Halolamina sp.]
MTLLETGAGLLVTAAVLGVTHGLEPDHAAGIMALTDDADGWVHAAFVGGTFASGHVLVVLAWVAVLSVVGRGADAAPGVFDALASVVPGVVLAGAGVLLVARGIRRLRGSSGGTLVAADGGAANRSAVTRLFDLAHGHVHRPHDGATDYIRTGVVGSLFALSPPVSMLALVSTVVPSAGIEGAAGAVVVYAAVITLTMAAVGGGIGETFAFLRGRGRRIHAALELTTGGFVLWFAAHLLL